MRVDDVAGTGSICLSPPSATLQLRSHDRRLQALLAADGQRGTTSQGGAGAAAVRGTGGGGVFDNHRSRSVEKEGLPSFAWRCGAAKCSRPENKRDPPNARRRGGGGGDVRRRQTPQPHSEACCGVPPTSTETFQPHARRAAMGAARRLPRACLRVK